MTKTKAYIAIDLKSFYASVECKERNRDPLTTNLVVADQSRTEKTICLAVSPSLKSYGIPGRPRLFEVVQKIKEVNNTRRWKALNRTFTGSSDDSTELNADPALKIDYIVAPPRMEYYLEYSSKIYNIYLKYIAPEDIFPYSIDEVFIDVDYKTRQSIKPMVMELEDMGVAVNLKLEILDSYKDFDCKLGFIGSVPVITFANRIYDWKGLFVKRCIDILGSLVGLVFMVIAMIFVAPAIMIESPGPIFFKQKRVGKNGRYFEIYKFRSMYMDAEERKKELMSQNEMSGLMFKMKDDPRITKVGKFIRKTSIDELPQFINVLKGDMSLVGTRPPTVGEFKQYEGHHKRRLSMKPGITGMWQAYGRKTVSDFEEIVKMDLDYIDNWSIMLDIKILFKTVQSVFTTGGQ